MTHRAQCARCRRPEALCVCSAVVPTEHRTGVTIVQHPAERGHAFGTARLAHMGLAGSDLIVAWDGGRMDRPPLPDGAALLWPGPNARDLAELTPAERPTHLVAVDGTWPQARSMYKLNPWMAELPQVSLSPDAPSEYRIRQEPAEHCLSTIESLGLALRLIEPDNAGLDRLLAAFRKMIDGQLAVRADLPSTPRTMSSRPKAVELMAACWESLVVVYAETTPLHKDPRDREIAQWAAVRPATGEVFDGLARPTELPNPCQLESMGLSAEALSAAPDAVSLRRAWEAFLPPDAQFAAWSRGGAAAGFIRIQQTIPPIFDLKSMYCNVLRGPSGTLDRVVEREQLVPAHVPVRGRAAGRLANSAAVAAWLAARGHDVAARRHPEREG